MQKTILRRPHGLIDYTYIPAVAAAPALAGFRDATTPTRLAYAFSGAVLASALCTRAEWGVLPIIPYRTHVALDFASGVLALAAPWLFRFSDNRAARNTFLAMGAAGVVVGLLSDPEEMPNRRLPVPKSRKALDSVR